MSRKGKIEIYDLISKEALSWGKEYQGNLKGVLKTHEDIINSLKNLSSVQKNLSSVKTEGEYKEIKTKSIKLTKAVTLHTKEQNRQIKQLLSTRAKLMNAQNDSNKSLQKEKVALGIVNKNLKEQEILNSKLVGAYQKLNLKRSQAQTLLKNVIAEGRRATETQKQYNNRLEQAQRIFNNYNNKVMLADRSTKDFTKNVGNYKSAFGKASLGIQKFTSAFGVVTGLYAFVEILKSSIKITKDFEKQNATLSGVLQVEKKDIADLTNEAERLGAVTVKSALEVSKLQTEYARLGFSQSEIIDMSEATINGSIAMNSELDRTAMLTGAVVRTFDDLNSSDADAIIDKMALSTSKTALSFEKLETAIPIVAGAANSAKIPFTKLLALLGKLSDSGIDASSSATALRNIFIESASKGLSYEQILEKIKNSSNKLTVATDEFGKRASVSANVLSANIDATKELDNELNNARGTAKEMADKELDTLSGALELLKSAVTGLILEEDKSIGATSRLKKGVRFLADNLGALFSTLKVLITGYATYKGTLVIVTNSKKVLTVVTNSLRIANIALSRGIKSSTRAMGKFNTVSKANVIGMIASLLATAVAAFIEFRKSVKEAAETESDLVSSIKKEQRGLNELVSKITSVNTSVKERSKLMGKLKKEYPAFLKMLGKENASNDELKTGLRDINELYIKRIALQSQQDKINKVFEKAGKRKVKTSIGNMAAKKMIDEANATFGFSVKYLDRSIDDALSELDAKLKEKAEYKYVSYNKIAKNEEARMSDRLENLRKNRLDVLKKEKEVNAELEKEQEFMSSLESELNTTMEDLNKLFNVDDKEGTNDNNNHNENNKAVESNKNLQKAIKNSLNWFDKQIETLEKERYNFSKNKDEARAYSEAIKELKNRREELYGVHVDIENIEKSGVDLDKNNLSDEYKGARVSQEKALFDSIEAIHRTAAKKLKNVDKDNWRERVSIATDGINEISELSNQAFQNRIDDLQYELEKSNEYYDQKIGLAKEDDEQRKILEAEKSQREREILNEQKKEKVKQAKYQKAFSIMQIGLNTAAKIMEFGAITPQAIAVGVIGALQLAKATAMKIPKYAKGTNYHKGGKAIVGDAFKHEVIYENGQAYVTPDYPTVVELEKGAKVFPDFKAFERAGLMFSLGNNKIELKKEDTNKEMFEHIGKNIKNEIKKGFSNVNLHINNTISLGMYFRNKNLD